MDPTKKEQLDELRADRSKVIGELRTQHDKLKAARRARSSDPLGHIEDLLLALVSLQETQDLIDRWERWEEQK